MPGRGAQRGSARRAVLVAPLTQGAGGVSVTVSVWVSVCVTVLVLVLTLGLVVVVVVVMVVVGAVVVVVDVGPVGSVVEGVTVSVTVCGGTTAGAEVEVSGVNGVVVVSVPGLESPVIRRAKP